LNSMLAFALSKYQFRGRGVILNTFLIMILLPGAVTLAPKYLVISTLGWNNNLLGVIIPTVASPTAVFLLRQYMLTLPDELLDAARVDGASEWYIYWRIIMPLSTPALATLAIFSVMWRWNDFLWPLIVLTENEKFTLQVALNLFQGQFDVQWGYLLAMTVLSLLPITIIFAFLQRYISTGIATTGLK
jgi:alpha-1,4-digalacturonate transport system permease protein